MKFSPTLHTLTSRTPEAPGAVRRFPAWTIPFGILLGFAALFLLLLGDRLLPGRKVDVALVLATPGEIAASSGTDGLSPGSTSGQAVLFQASGWIEPAPFPIKATALIDGVVDKVLVATGQTVSEGQLLATLVAEDMRLAHAAARHRLQTVEAALQAHHAAIAAAEQRVTGLKAELAAAIARRDEAEDLSRRFAQLPEGSVSKTDVISARLRHLREVAQADAAAAAVEQMRAELVRLNAETGVKRGELDTASVAVEQAALALRRTEIPSPTNGRILRLLAAPGQRKTMMVDDPDASTIAILYRPGDLQVRVDVPLADASAMQVGQSARIHCALLPEKVLHGQVTHIAGEADVQRNTLQAKVRITEPADSLRPEMLCRVEFLRSPTGGEPQAKASSNSLALWIPESALADGAVWICDPDSNRLESRRVESTGETRDGYVRVSAGVRPGEWVVLAPRDLRAGQRVTPNLLQP